MHPRSKLPVLLRKKKTHELASTRDPADPQVQGRELMLSRFEPSSGPNFRRRRRGGGGSNYIAPSIRETCSDGENRSAPGEWEDGKDSGVGAHVACTRRLGGGGSSISRIVTESVNCGYKCVEIIWKYLCFLRQRYYFFNLETCSMWFVNIIL